MIKFGINLVDLAMINLKTKLSKTELKKIKTLYKRSFPKCERKPFAMILRSWCENRGEIYGVFNGDKFAGLVLTLISPNAVLIDYLAILPKFQSQKIGGAVLSNLMQIYKDKAIFCEIESTENVWENSLKFRRKRFYLKNGLFDTGIKISLWGVKMELLSNRKNAKFDEYFEIYRHAYGDKFELKIKQII
ncbi:MAG: GNAT family N-acetyltransferase [Campylobacter sp.]|nr:GNAT family N-acetyltransferase [Campylobacter sp.]MBR0071541.1 GNAT family N-acetyltransferase [Campylobacter sp.]